MNAADIVIRDLSGQFEMRKAEELQKEVWGFPDIDVVPLTQMVAVKASGGIVIGAFDGEVLAGFAYGFVGYEDGRVTHHSHMLAVRPGYRSLNIGYLLKLEQRRRALEQGLDQMTWTFDPLQSVNAYFNFSKLGVVSDRYFVNFYGEKAASFLHRNGTDRLWVTWLLNSTEVCDRLNGISPSFEVGGVLPMTEVEQDLTPSCRGLDQLRSGDQPVIEIPADMASATRLSREITLLWREATRAAFTEAFAHGYYVGGFYREDRGGQKVGRYLLKENRSAADEKGKKNE